MSLRLLIGLFLIGFLVSSIALPYSVEGQEIIELTIKSDGSIEPDTTLLDRNGSVYTLKSDIYGAIKVERGYLTLDGAGHTLQVNNSDGALRIAKGATRCTHVLVKNLRISNSDIGLVSVLDGNNSFIGNYFEDTSVLLQGGGNFSGDLLRYNTFKKANIIIDYSKSGKDTITENNFIECGIELWMSSSPIVDRNYWSNYTAKYPNATEVAGCGVWDTPYVLHTLRGTVVDNHPLVKPIADFEITSFKVSVASPTPYTTSPNGKDSNLLSQTVLTVTVSLAVTAIILVVLLTVFRSKYREAQVKKVV